MTVFILVAALVVAVLYGTALRARLTRLADIHAEICGELEAAEEDVAYHQDLEDRLRNVVQQLFGPDAVMRIDEALWAADLACRLDTDTREWLEGQR